MSDEDWNAGFVKCLGVRLAGDLIDDVDERGEPIVGDTLLLLLNAHREPIPFTLPPDQARTSSGSGCWTRPTRARSQRGFEGGEQYPLQDRSLAVLVTRKPEEKGQAVTSTRGQGRPLRRRRSQREHSARALADLTGDPASTTCLRVNHEPDRDRRDAAVAGSTTAAAAPAAARVDLPPAVSRAASPSATRRRSCRTCATWASPTATPRPT